MRLNRYAAVAALVLLTSLLLLATISPAGAAKGGVKGKPGGGGGGGGGGDTSAAALVVTATATPGAVLVSGTGFSPNKDLTFYITGSWPRIVRTDGAGQLAFTHTLEGEGPWTFRATQYSKKRWRDVASTTYGG